MWREYRVNILASFQCWLDDNIMLIISNCSVSEVLSVIQKKTSKKGKTFRVLSGNTKIAFSVTILLHSSLVMFPFFRRVYKKKAPEKGTVFPGILHVATGSCLPPQVSRRSPAERLSRWSPPACPPLEGCQPCPATWSPSPPPEPESLQGFHR